MTCPSRPCPATASSSAAQPPREEGLRNDVACFVGSTVRGPLGVPVRVQGRQAFVATFGGWESGTVPRAFAAYVANGGEVAWIVRAGCGGTPATKSVGLAPEDPANGPARLALPGSGLRFTATSPGAWGNGIRVRLTYRAFGFGGDAELDITIDTPRAATFRRAGLNAEELIAAVAATGTITAEFCGPSTSITATSGNPGPAALGWDVVLDGGTEPALDEAALRTAIEAQAEIEEIALVCVPGFAEVSEAAQDAVLSTLAASCASAQDRLAVVSAPVVDAASFATWRDRAARGSHRPRPPAGRRRVPSLAPERGPGRSRTRPLPHHRLGRPPLWCPRSNRPGTRFGLEPRERPRERRGRPGLADTDCSARACVRGRRERRP